MQASPTRIAPLSHRALIMIEGPDWATFLKGLCTARIDDMAAESAGPSSSLHYGAFLRPQGKMYADCLLLRTGAEAVQLDVPATAREELLAKLNMYKLRAKVTITADDAPVFAAFGGDLPAGFLADPRSRITGETYGMAYAPHSANASAGDWAAFRYGLGIAEAGFDFGKDELYAIDANLDLLDAIDFHKGCYVGQELTSRMKRRGQIRNRILPLTHGGVLEKGAEILNGDVRAGDVLASTPGLSLGLMRLDRLNGNLTCAGKTAIVTQSWIASSVKINV